MPMDLRQYPSLGGLRLDTLGSWTGEAELAPGHQVHVMYVCDPVPVSLRRATGAVRAILERVARGEWDYRRKVARAWIDVFHEQAGFARSWTDDDLAQRLVLRGILLGSNDQRVVLEYGGPTDKELKTWFNADGSLSHISGDLFE